jgi:hypothetical protein
VSQLNLPDVVCQNQVKHLFLKCSVCHSLMRSDAFDIYAKIKTQNCLSTLAICLLIVCLAGNDWSAFCDLVWSDYCHVPRREPTRSRWQKPRLKNCKRLLDDVPV